MSQTVDSSARRVGPMEAIGDRWRALPKWQRSLGFVAFVAFLYYLPLLGIPGLTWLRTDYIQGGSSWAGTLFTCAIYILVAIGLNVVIGLAGLLDLGYIGFFAIGAYGVGLFGSVNSPVVKLIQQEFGLSSTWAVSWTICLFIAMVLAMVSGVLLGWPTLRLRGDYLAIVTLGFGEIIRIVARNVKEVTNGAAGISAVPGPEGPPSADNTVFGLIDVKPWYWLAITFVLIMVFFVRRLENSRVGRAWLAVREDEDAAAVMGVNPFKFKLWAFAIGAVLGGVAGVLFASRQAFIDPTKFDPMTSILFVAMVVVGGSGNMLGVSLGAFLLVYLPERFRGIAEYRMLAFGVAMVLVMILRPQGLIPSRRRTRELKDRAAEGEETPAHV